MNDRKFSGEEAIRFGWEAMKKNFLFFAVFLVVITSIGFGLGIADAIMEENTPASIAVGLLASIFQLAIGIAMLTLTLGICDRGNAEIEDIFSGWPRIGHYFLGSLLYGLIVFLGMLLLFVPGVIWAIKFQFYSFYIIDKKAGPIAALKMSAKLTQGVKLSLFLFGIQLAVINMLGALCLFVGLFATIPTTSLAFAYIYRSLDKQLSNIPVGSSQTA
ncbi:MAG: hypothetical protein KJ893_01520 [Candidatus Omnitrophica bacterium]|nr:hypothetical protein [Candidatus Omnitrophota bacterium]MBU4478812.1 hypothetical protein [Candidatus Omnitrophota bacterium]MCG2702883.1 hypothetical protein [Candidatus Omnitrophota bacterium]